MTEQLRSLLYRGASMLLAANVIFFFIFLAIGGPISRHFYHSPKLADYIPWFAALMILGVLSNFYGRVLTGYKAVGRRTVITNFFGTPTTMALAILLVSLGYGLRGYLLAQVAAAALVIVALLVEVWRRTPPGARILRPWPRRLEPEVRSFSAAAVGSLILEFVAAHVDKIALGYYFGAVTTGIYSVAAAIAPYLSLILTSVNQIFSPIIADLHAKGDHAMLARLYAALTKWVLAVTLPLIIVVAVYARPLMRIFGPDFEAGWPILIIGALAQLINCAVGSVGTLLWMSGNQRVLLRVQAVMAIFMVVATFSLVPFWGIIGAAIAAALNVAGMNIGNLIAVRRVLRLSPFNRSFSHLLLPACGALFTSLLVRHESRILLRDWVSVLVSLVATYAIFLVTALALGLSPDDRLIAGAIRHRIQQWLPN
jgi:O-antigen/teichoic acid export membrane protein